MYDNRKTLYIYILYIDNIHTRIRIYKTSDYIQKNTCLSLIQKVSSGISQPVVLVKPSQKPKESATPPQPNPAVRPSKCITRVGDEKSETLDKKIMPA